MLIQPYDFSPGNLVMFAGSAKNKKEIFIIIREYFDDLIMAPRLQVLTTSGELVVYHPAWLKDLD